MEINEYMDIKNRPLVELKLTRSDAIRDIIRAIEDYTPDVRDMITATLKKEYPEEFI
jgi:hypothetical protein